MNTTVFYERHEELGARLVDFAGWHMPVQYKTGIIQEHLNTRKTAGLFDVSHMGRFIFKGDGSLAFLQRVLTNDAAALKTGQSQYTIIADEAGGAIDDAYLYKFKEDEYLLVVNASNREKDWQHLIEVGKKYSGMESEDVSDAMAMISLQGPQSENMLKGLTAPGSLPEPVRNALGITSIKGTEVLLARTGYTGEPFCYELFMERASALAVWDLLLEKGAVPVGLGARDTLRLEAGLPLYGHELGKDNQDKTIPILSSPASRYAVSFSSGKGDYIGHQALRDQWNTLTRIRNADFSQIEKLSRMIRVVALTGKGIAREGAKVYHNGNEAGYVTSGTMVPYWKPDKEGVEFQPGNEHANRAICLALLDSTIGVNSALDIEVRGRMIPAVTVPRHLRGDSQPYARPVIHKEEAPPEQ